MSFRGGLASAERVSLLGNDSILVGFGLLRDIVDDLRSLVSVSRYAIVTDENVAPLYLGVLRDAFLAAGIEPLFKVIPPGESQKTRRTKEDLEDWLLEVRLSSCMQCSDTAHSITATATRASLRSAAA